MAPGGPRTVTCGTCGEQFFPASFKFHASRCAQKHQAMVVPCPHCGKQMRRSDMEQHLGRCKAARKAQQEAETALKDAHQSHTRAAAAAGGGRDPPALKTEETTKNTSKLAQKKAGMACGVCGRFFAPDRLVTHQAICLKNEQRRKQRSVFKARGEVSAEGSGSGGLESVFGLSKQSSDNDRPPEASFHTEMIGNVVVSTKISAKPSKSLDSDKVNTVEQKIDAAEVTVEGATENSDDTRNDEPVTSALASAWQQRHLKKRPPDDEKGAVASNTLRRDRGVDVPQTEELPCAPAEPHAVCISLADPVPVPSLRDSLNGSPEEREVEKERSWGSPGADSLDMIIERDNTGTRLSLRNEASFSDAPLRAEDQRSSAPALVEAQTTAPAVVPAIVPVGIPLSAPPNAPAHKPSHAAAAPATPLEAIPVVPAPVELAPVVAAPVAAASVAIPATVSAAGLVAVPTAAQVAASVANPPCGESSGEAQPNTLPESTSAALPASSMMLEHGGSNHEVSQKEALESSSPPNKWVISIDMTGMTGSNSTTANKSRPPARLSVAGAPPRRSRRASDEAVLNGPGLAEHDQVEQEPTAMHGSTANQEQPAAILSRPSEEEDQGQAETTTTHELPPVRRKLNAKALPKSRFLPRHQASTPPDADSLRSDPPQQSIVPAAALSEKHKVASTAKLVHAAPKRRIPAVPHHDTPAPIRPESAASQPHCKEEEPVITHERPATPGGLSTVYGQMSSASANRQRMATRWAQKRAQLLEEARLAEERKDRMAKHLDQISRQQSQRPIRTRITPTVTAAAALGGTRRPEPVQPTIAPDGTVIPVLPLAALNAARMRGERFRPPKGKVPIPKKAPLPKKRPNHIEKEAKEIPQISSNSSHIPVSTRVERAVPRKVLSHTKSEVNLRRHPPTLQQLQQPMASESQLVAPVPLQVENDNEEYVAAKTSTLEIQAVAAVADMIGEARAKEIVSVEAPGLGAHSVAQLLKSAAIRLENSEAEEKRLSQEISLSFDLHSSPLIETEKVALSDVAPRRHPLAAVAVTRQDRASPPKSTEVESTTAVEVPTDDCEVPVKRVHGNLSQPASPPPRASPSSSSAAGRIGQRPSGPRQQQQHTSEIRSKSAGLAQPPLLARLTYSPVQEDQNDPVDCPIADGGLGDAIRELREFGDLPMPPTNDSDGLRCLPVNAEARVHIGMHVRNTATRRPESSTGNSPSRSRHQMLLGSFGADDLSPDKPLSNSAHAIPTKHIGQVSTDSGPAAGAPAYLPSQFGLPKSGSISVPVPPAIRRAVPSPNPTAAPMSYWPPQPMCRPPAVAVQYVIHPLVRPPVQPVGPKHAIPAASYTSHLPSPFNGAYLQQQMSTLSLGRPTPQISAAVFRTPASTAAAVPPQVMSHERHFGVPRMPPNLR